MHVAERALDRGMISGEFNQATAGMLALLSMLRWERKVGRAALEHLGIDHDRLARALDDAIAEEGRQAQRPGGPEIEVLPSGQRGLVMDTHTPVLQLLDQAEHEAIGLGHDWVGTEHLLLAAVRLACPRLQELLRASRVSIDGVRQAILVVLQS
jgi:ATP-dependent Clp protease ATP-binding subunit ClpA